MNDSCVTNPSLVETPSGKGARDENFPVGSILLPKRLRPHVATFYAFARAIDDIADNPDLASIDKVARLDGFDLALRGENDDPAYAKALRLRVSLQETGVTTRHGSDLISAFKQDSVKSRYESWDDLMDYCLRSAAPVGRYLLDLHGESQNAWPYSDALCNALQVINHLQDCADDYREIDRVYLPGDWMQAAGANVEALGAETATEGLKEVIRRCVEATDELLVTARCLPAELTSRSLAAESSVIIVIAERLSGLLGQGDPVAERIELSKPQVVGCGIRGLARALLGDAGTTR